MPALRTRDTSSRTLEVSTDVTPTTDSPSLNLISPTPRAFTFPVEHNLNDTLTPSPCSTPSRSPSDFYRSSPQPTLYTATPPPLFLTLSPPPQPPSPSPGPSRHRKRRSSATDEALERRPKKGEVDYVKRPENAFILFRRSATSGAETSATTGKKQRQADLSKTISHQWKSLTPEERKHWEDLAKEKKKEHEEMYPNYVYRPQRTGKAKGKSKTRKDSMDYEHETQMVSQVPQPAPSTITFSVPLTADSSSGPTYQQLEVPNVYNGDGSCPSSELSLLPMFQRRSVFPGGDCNDSFDYVPQNPSNYMMPPPQFPEMPQYMNEIYAQDQSKSLGVDIPDHHFLGHNGQGMISPSSSNNSSPQTGPYTPTLGMDYDQQGSQSSDWCIPPAALDYDMQMGIQLQQEVDYSQYTNFSWGGESIWNNQPTTFNENDFDLSAIPPIELGIPPQDNELIYLPEQPDSVEVDDGGKGYHYVSQQPLEEAEGNFGQQQQQQFEFNFDSATDTQA